MTDIAGVGDMFSISRLSQMICAIDKLKNNMGA